MQQPDPDRAHSIRFQASGRSYHAEVVSGPGGNFLSNEVSYRVLRQLSQMTGASPPVSFHVHTQRGDPVPEARGRARAAALRAASGVRQKLISSLKGIIVALARRLATGSGQGSQGP